jgi:hypothetical protein
MLLSPVLLFGLYLVIFVFVPPRMRAVDHAEPYRNTARNMKTHVNFKTYIFALAG